MTDSLKETVDFLAGSVSKKKLNLKRALRLKLGKSEFTIDPKVDPENCESITEFIPPSKGASKRKFDFLMAILASEGSKPVWIWGPPGIGKDYMVRAWSSLTRTQCQTYQVRSDVDVQNEWLYERSFNSEGTFVKYNRLWLDLTEGRDGRAMHVILSDFDRATRDQIAVLRSLLDSDKPFLTGPSGENVPVLKGTRIIVTANSGGMGDERGLCTDAMSIDSSIMDRFTFKLRFPQLSWDDESRMISARYPDFAEVPEWMEALKGCTSSIRDAARAGDIYMEFSHRGVQGIVSNTLMMKSITSSNEKALRWGLREWLEGTTPDEETQLAVKRLCDPHLKGGTLSEV
jgi:hypothetical protein